ncbi:MAG: malonyl CoA-acyl carrier protein transacylase, partial [Sutterella sp.]
DAIRTALARQASSAVQWVRTIERMKAEGVTDVVECGPGKVLTGLLRRTAPELSGHNIYDAATLAAVLEKLQ